MIRYLFDCIEELRGSINNSDYVFIFLDYDGTLVPIKKRPELAKLSKDTKLLLGGLSKHKDYSVVVVSGRSLADIKNLVGIRSLGYAGSHGLEFDGFGLKYRNKDSEKTKKVIGKIREGLKRRIKIKGFICQDKGLTLSAHYRLIKEEDMLGFKESFFNIVNHYVQKGLVKITLNKKVFDIGPNLKWNKGSIIKWFLGKQKRKNSVLIYIGDDNTDEDAFTVLKKEVTILVSNEKKNTKARFYLRNPAEVLKFLKIISKF